MPEVLKLNLNELLQNFIEDPENSDNNFKLGIYYDSIGQTASAISYYLRTAERSYTKVLKLPMLCGVQKRIYYLLTELFPKHG